MTPEMTTVVQRTRGAEIEDCSSHATEYEVSETTAGCNEINRDCGELCGEMGIICDGIVSANAESGRQDCRSKVSTEIMLPRESENVPLLAIEPVDVGGATSVSDVESSGSTSEWSDKLLPSAIKGGRDTLKVEGASSMNATTPSP